MEWIYLIKQFYPKTQSLLLVLLSKVIHEDSLDHIRLYLNYSSLILVPTVKEHDICHFISENIKSSKLKKN